MITHPQSAYRAELEEAFAHISRLFAAQPLDRIPLLDLCDALRVCKASAQYTDPNAMSLIFRLATEEIQRRLGADKWNDMANGQEARAEGEQLERIQML